MNQQQNNTSLNHIFMEGDEEEDYEEKPCLKTTILKLLKGENIPLNGLDTLEIAKLVIGPSGTQKEVNPTLYELLKEGSVVKLKIKNKARPHWKISEK